MTFVVDWAFTPFIAPACKSSGLKDARTHLKKKRKKKEHIFRSCNTSIFNAIRFDEDHFTCQFEKENKKTRVLNYALLSVAFKEHHGSEGVNIPGGN